MKMNKTYIRLAGIFGLIFFGFGILSSLFFYGAFERFPWLMAMSLSQIFLGLGGIATYLFFNLTDTMLAIWRKRESLFGVLGGFFLLLILVGANVIAHSEFGERKFDLTLNKIHSLDSQTVATLENLTSEIEVLSFLTNPDAKARMDNLMEKYLYKADLLEYRQIDPDTAPALVRELGAGSNNVVIRNQETNQSVTLNLRDLNEEKLTTAIRRVLVATERKLGFLTGLGEADLNSEEVEGLSRGRELLKNEGFKIEMIDVAQLTEIPDDIDVVVLWGPERAVPETTVLSIEQYLEGGGDLVIAQDPLFVDDRKNVLKSGLESFVNKYGLELGGSLVSDFAVIQRGMTLQPGLFPLFNAVPASNHPIVKPLSERAVNVSLAQGVFQLDSFKNENFKRQALIATTDRGKTDDGQTGIIPLAQFVERTVQPSDDKGSGTRKNRIIVFGDSDFARNENIQKVFNQDLFLNTFNYLAGQTASLTIRSKLWKSSTLEIQPEEKSFVYYASLCLVPQILLLLGFSIWTMRRSRHQ